MKDKKRTRALPLTIILGSSLLVVVIALTTLWNIVLVNNHFKLKKSAGNLGEYSGMSQWIILGIGSFLFALIIAGVILFIIFMARQIIVNQMQKSFIDGVTHELKTPLTSLQLYIQTLKKHDLPLEKRNEFLDFMLLDVERLNILVNHVLEAAKLDHMHHVYQSENINLKHLLEYCRDIVSHRYKVDSGSFHFDVADLEIQSDPNALQLVFINLLDNAIKYSSDNIKVIVNASEEISGKISITIQDFGVGISQSELKNVFKRFYRSPRGIESQQKGSGLGLFIVKQTIKHLKGQIHVFSDGPETGTSFVITLPGESL